MSRVKKSVSDKYTKQYELYIKECKLINKKPMGRPAFIMLINKGHSVTDIAIKRQGGKGVCRMMYREISKKFNISYATITLWHKKGVTQDEMEERLTLMNRQHKSLTPKRYYTHKAKTHRPQWKLRLIKWFTKLLG